MIIETTSPTRVDLAGGTLDLWPLHVFTGNCLTIQLAIDIKTYVSMKVRDDNKINIDLVDINVKKSYESLSDFLSDSDPKVQLVKVQAEYFMPEFGFEIETRSDSMVGGGLGGSSSLCVSLIKSFCSAMKKTIDLESMVTLASNMEARVLNTPTGTQDYYAPISPGLNCIEYGWSGRKLTQMDYPEDLWDHIILINSGKSHHSGLNNWEIMKKAVDRDPTVCRGLDSLNKIAFSIKDAISTRNWKEIPRLFDEEYRIRQEFATGYIVDEIQSIKDYGMENGASAVKVCGAGGGGCLMLWVDPEKKQELEELCQKRKIAVVKTKPVLAVQ